MKYYIIFIMSLCFLELSTSIHAQINHNIFAGGSADGHGQANFVKQANNGIFSGGNGDGQDVHSIVQSFNNSIFGGGTADGHAVVNYQQQINGSIFMGGSGDGHSLAVGTLGNSNNDCTQHTLDVNDALIQSSLDHTFKAQQIIRSGASLTTFNEFLFRAASEIELQPGFTVPNMVTFNLEIGPCESVGSTKDH